MPRRFPQESIVLFEPGSASPELWAAYHDYRRVRHQESRPDDTMLPDEVFEKKARRPDPFSERRRFIVQDAGAIIAMVMTGWAKPGSPGYESNKQYAWAGGSVHADYRRQGIGSALARRVAQVMEEVGTSVLTMDTEEESGNAFLRWLGAAVKMEAAENRLHLRELDWDMMDHWIEDGRRRSPDTTLEFYPDRVPEEIWEEHAASLQALLNTMPFDDLDHGEIVVTAEALKDYQERMDELGAYIHTYIAREPDGTVSGLTDVRFLPARPDRVEQLFTGVYPEARGRGIGKLLKASMARYIRERHPEARWVTTGNAESNAPMLAINRRMGFQTYRGETVYQIGLDALQEKLGSI